MSRLRPVLGYADIRPKCVLRLVIATISTSTLIWVPWLWKPRTVLRSLGSVYLTQKSAQPGTRFWEVLGHLAGSGNWISATGMARVSWSFPLDRKQAYPGVLTTAVHIHDDLRPRAGGTDYRLRFAVIESILDPHAYCRTSDVGWSANDTRITYVSVAASCVAGVIAHFLRLRPRFSRGVLRWVDAAQLDYEFERRQ